MNLSPEQQELLGAYLDNELSSSERALAQALLEREEARTYVEEIRTLKAALTTHLKVSAPADFRVGVLAALEGDFDSISRPTSHKQPAPVHSLPSFNWKTPFMAVAAAVVVALGLLFGGVLFDPPQSAAPQSAAGGVAMESAGDTVDSRKSAKSIVQPPTPAPRETGNPEKSGPDAPKDVRPGSNTDKHPKTPEDAPDGKGPDDDLGRDSQSRELQQHAFDAAEFNTTEISLCYNRNSSASLTQLYTELLGVSSLYGNASLEASTIAYSVASVGTDFTFYSGVEIELEEARIPELLAALERLSAGNNFGRVVLPAYLRRDVSKNMREIESLQAQVQSLERGEVPATPAATETPENWTGKDAARREKMEKERRATDPNFKRAAGYLPPEVLRQDVKRLESELRGNATAGGARKPAKPEVENVPALGAAKSGSVRLVIKIQ